MKKKHLSTIILILVFVAGLSLVLYPTVSNYYNAHHATRAVNNYTKTLETMSENDRTHYLEEAEAYNASLLTVFNRYHVTGESLKVYQKTLRPDSTGIMGYIEIPILHIQLPIYHTVEERVLQTAVGHMPGSSLPVGGESTHCVLTGHRGLPSAKLFTDLDRLVVGDTFTISVMDRELTYEVDQIRIIEPQNLEQLEIVPGEDYCTLVTCTPYGINTHRLLVRGKRIPTNTVSMHVVSEAVKLDRILVAPFFAVPVCLVLLCVLFIRYRNR